MNDDPEADRSTLRPLAKVRGYLAMAFVGVALLVSDVLQRTVVAAAARLFPRARHRILTFWIQAMRITVLDIAFIRIGGAQVGSRPVVPARPGVLVIMNHQSLLDIPLVVGACQGGYPRIVTRRRYTHGIPLISHMTRLYQYPVVDPQATVKGHLHGLREAAENGDTPLAIFPEGTRTRDGQLSRWKRSGLRVILSARQWDVYILVVDGLWTNRHYVDMTQGVSGLRGRVERLGPFRSPPPEEDVEAFIEDMQTRMRETLTAMRRSPA